MGCPHGVMVKALADGIVVRKFETPVTLLRSLRNKCLWERYEWLVGFFMAYQPL